MLVSSENISCILWEEVFCLFWQIHISHLQTWRTIFWVIKNNRPYWHGIVLSLNKYIFLMLSMHQSHFLALWIHKVNKINQSFFFHGVYILIGREWNINMISKFYRMLDGAKYHGKKNRVGRWLAGLSVYNFRLSGWWGPYWRKKVVYKQIIEGRSGLKHMDFRERTFQAEWIGSPKGAKMDRVIEIQEKEINQSDSKV